MFRFPSLALVALLPSCAMTPRVREVDPPEAQARETTEFVLISEVDWEQLNPARGDKSPQAGTLWGDRKGVVPTGYLIKFEDGFSSPPHIHNVSYRGAVIRGEVHNDDPAAKPMWMGPGSFWTQPKGEVHITAARGANNLAYIEIDKGPYLVLPTARAFDSGERPVNVEASNLVWLDAEAHEDVAPTGARASAPQLQIAYLWGKPAKGARYGAFLKLPPGTRAHIETADARFQAVVIQGQVRYFAKGANEKILAPGSYFASKGRARHPISGSQSSETIVYIRTTGALRVHGAKPDR